MPPEAELREPTLVVGVGASAGGLQAFKELLRALPEESGMAFLLVQHLDPKHESLLPELLGPRTGMRVVSADAGARIEPDRVYVIRPDTELSVRDGRLEVGTPKLVRGVRLPVDHLLHSLAREYGPRAAGLVLSGAGSDGSNGLRHLKRAGGLTIAQDPETCDQTGMPRSAIDVAVPDLVLPIADMPTALLRFAAISPEVRRGYAPDEAPERPAETKHFDEEQLARLADVVRARLDLDMDSYKAGTIERRVLRRMALGGFGELDDYLDHLRRSDAEQRTLVRDLLIGVTFFFRDPQAFEALRTEVAEPLLERKPAGEPIRVWVPGCATGEEAYSIGIELLEAMMATKVKRELQVFATDVDREALDVARRAVYPASISEQVPEDRLLRYFQLVEGEGYRVRRDLRDVVSFAVHDLTRNPPFSGMDLVSCRNVLIYLRTSAQRSVLGSLHFALKPDGDLMLSPSESTAADRALFACRSKRWALYRKLGRSRHLGFLRAEAPPRGAAAGEERQRDARGSAGRRREHDLARKAVIGALLGPTLVVLGDGSVVFLHGDLRPYLRFPEGDAPRLDLADMLEPALANRVRGALYRCRRSGEPVTTTAERTDRALTRITAAPAPALGDGAVVLTFADVERSAPAAPDERAAEAPVDGMVAELERELHATREDLRSTVDELETSNEELRSSNEESMSMNEELQSSNEELEASTEELRALNEELTTVNTQLREKVAELEEAHDDLNNFFASTKLATIFLDERLRIRRFTPAAGDLLDLEAGDLGRRSDDVARDLLRGELEHDVRDVLKELTPRSREVRSADGRWFERSILPYRTEARRIEGVTVTWHDVTELKESSERFARHERRQRAVANIGLGALQHANVKSVVEQVVRDVSDTLEADFCGLFEVQPENEELVLRAGVGWREGAVGAATLPAGPASPPGYALHNPGPVTVEDLPEDRRFSETELFRDHRVTSGVACVIRAADAVYGVLGAYTSDRRRFTGEDGHFVQAVANALESAINRHQTRMRMSLELGIAGVLADAGDLEEALVAVVEHLAAELEFDAAEVWWPDEPGGRLACRTRFIGSQGEPGRVERGDAARATGRELAERARHRGAAFWASGVESRPGWSPSPVRSALVFPIAGGREVLGATVLHFGRTPFAGEVLLHSLELIGRAIGDFVARFRAESRMRRLAAITESSHDAIFSYDVEGRVTEWLEGAERLFGYRAAEMIGSSIHLIVPPERRGEIDDVVARILRGEVIEPFETERLDREGRPIPISARSSPVKDVEGRVVGISSNDRDIRHQKQVEERLLEADRQKDRFLAMLGHELRNPLAAIRSATDLLRAREDPDAELAELGAILDRQCGHIKKLLDGLLDVSRIIRGRIDIEREPVDLAEVCREVLQDLRTAGFDADRDLRVELPRSAVWVSGDRVRLSQVVDNLLGNALKYTSEGGRVTLRLSAAGEEARLVVEDDGVGIEPELLPYVFDVFRQSEQTLDRASGGLGLGLSLCRSLVSLHGGRISATSDGRGRGAAFEVLLPLTDARPGAEAGGPKARPKLRVLVVEDHADSARALARLLEAAGHEVAVANDGTRGLERARALRPDLVLCDLGLPGGLSGYDVARALREDAATRDAHLVALSGYGQPEDRRDSRAAGFGRHLTKPLDPRALDELVEAVGRARE